ncbi:iron chaperone [Rhodococcus sp. NPDC058532]|uniref:iron chaperone n=1 Tax=Rhodococcus sp. NPDC058532 TaxID=3346540 RepID=UPI00364D93AD
MAQNGSGFSAEERAAMKEAAAERRAQAKADKSAAKRELNLQGVLDAIAAMDDADRVLAERFHAIVTETAPDLEPKTWYGMPAYGRDGTALCFFQAASKFKARYATIGFQDTARLDDGEFWPTSFAVVSFTDDVAARVKDLVARAVE